MRMHRLVPVGALIALAAGLGSNAALAAQEVDISTLTCTQLQELDADAIGFALVWIDGYLGGRSDDTVFDLDRMSANAAEVDRVCAKSPNKSVLSIIKAYEAKQAR